MVESNTATVSVVIPAYNAGESLRQTLESVLAQTITPQEIVIVDDGSTDDTAIIAQFYARRDDRIRLISQPNGGVSRARNAGVEHAHGSHVAFLDSDDHWLPTHLEEFAKMNAHKGIYAAQREADKTGLVEAHDYRSYVQRVLDRGWGLNMSGVIIEREVARAHMFREGFTTGEELDFLLRALRRGGQILTLSPRTTAICDLQGTQTSASRPGRLSWSALDRPNAIVAFCDEELSGELDGLDRDLILALRRRTELSVIKSLVAQRRFRDLGHAVRRIRRETRSPSLWALSTILGLALPFNPKSDVL